MKDMDPYIKRDIYRSISVLVPSGVAYLIGRACNVDDDTLRWFVENIPLGGTLGSGLYFLGSLGRGLAEKVGGPANTPRRP